MTLLTMSDNELSRIDVIKEVLDKRLKQQDAASILGVGARQLQRLLKAYKHSGPEGIISRHRGRPSNRRYPEPMKEYGLFLIKRHYLDFGPTLAAEKLAEQHDFIVSVETLRQWMMAAQFWVPRKDKGKRIHQPRGRRDCLGELVQIDGSEHRWFEDRGPKCTLLVYIDDATSRLMELRFAPSETTFDYFISTRRYLAGHGKPVAFYSDKHAIFRINKVGATTGTGMTQFGRALYELNIEMICANSPQAKGRVERMNKTLQDRLVKELRLRGLSDMDSANAYLPEFIRRYNAKFKKVAHNGKDLHRPLTESSSELDDIFAWREERTVSNSLTLQYDRVLYLLTPNELTRTLKRKRVNVFDYANGTIAIQYQGQALPYSLYDKVCQVDQGSIVSNKRLGAMLAFVKEEQEKKSVQRSKRAPVRTGQKQHFRTNNPAVVNE